MWLTLDDLQCPRCGAFVHPLLDTCPTCGAAHVSRRAEAADGAIGAVRLAEAPETQRLAQNLTLRYTIKVNAIGRSEPDATLLSALAHLAEALTYRISGDAVPTTDDATLGLRDGSLVAQVRASGALLAEIPLREVLGAAARHGEVTLAYPPPVAGAARGLPGAPTGLEGAPTGPEGALHLTVANRRGILASKARDDHFVALARWLGVLAAAAAERHWIEVGLLAYLAELGLVAGGPAGSSAVIVDAPVTGTVTDPAAAARGSVQASLVELESLRGAGLVADEEYADKRREILARL